MPSFTTTKSTKIYIAGHTGMVGSAVKDEFSANGYHIIVTFTPEELDLRNQQATNEFIASEKPGLVIIAAAKVGGILANKTYPWEFIYDNLMIEANLINACHTNNINELIFLGSSCIYPRDAPQPLKEEYLLTGPLEPTNEYYAIAKIAGIKMCQAINRQYGRNYLSLMPTNLYGFNDNFNLQHSHVLPAMIRKFHEAKIKGNVPVILWGTGTPKREFMHIQDLARAIRFIVELKENTGCDILNVGTGRDMEIRELAAIVKEITGHTGMIIWDNSKPDGTMRKLLDTTKINNLGWQPAITIEDGITEVYNYFCENYDKLRK